MQVTVQPGNENIVHHILIHQCLDEFSAQLESLLNGPGVNCIKYDAVAATCPLFFMGFTMAKLASICFQIPSNSFIAIICILFIIYRMK